MRKNNMIYISLHAKYHNAELTAIPKTEKLSDKAALKKLGFDIKKEDNEYIYISSEPSFIPDIELNEFLAMATQYNFTCNIQRNGDRHIFAGGFSQYSADNMLKMLGDCPFGNQGPFKDILDRLKSS